MRRRSDERPAGFRALADGPASRAVTEQSQRGCRRECRASQKRGRRTEAAPQRAGDYARQQQRNAAGEIENSEGRSAQMYRRGIGDELGQQALREGKVMLDHTTKSTETPHREANLKERKFGTVGAVALDKQGNLAAATSTGGLTNKRFGRVGDSPIIGAGTYADNATCAVSCTGVGEYFIKNVVAYDIACLIKYKDMPLPEAADWVVMHKLAPIGGEGGLIALDAKGNIALPFNSAGMYRAWLREGETAQVAIF